MAKKIFIIIIIFTIVAAAFFLDSAFIEPNLLITRNKVLYVPNWNKKLDGFKIALVADLHIGSQFVNLGKLDTVIKKVNEKNPDLIILAGDLDALAITDSKINTEDIANKLNQFKAKYGVFAILGNHDYQPAGIVRSLFKNADIPLLANQSRFIYVNGQPVEIVGFEDLWHSKFSPQKVIEQRPSKDIPIIVLSHNPDVLPEIPSNVTLTLSGHIHGGEVIIPFLGAPFIPSNYGQRFRKGYIVENNKHLYVSGGIATTSGFRFLNPPEIVFLTLYRQTDKTKINNTKPLKGINKNYIPDYLKFIKKLKF